MPEHKIPKMGVKTIDLTYPNNSLAQLDYIYKQELDKQHLKCNPYYCFEGVSSNQKIVFAKIHLCLCRNKKQIYKPSWYDWFLFTNSDIGNQYTLQKTPEKYIPKDEYENFITTHIEAAAKCIPIKPRAKCRIPFEVIAVWVNEITWKKHPYLIKENQ